jgi:hypothetical protein
MTCPGSVLLVSERADVPSLSLEFLHVHTYIYFILPKPVLTSYMFFKTSNLPSRTGAHTKLLQ